MGGDFLISSHPLSNLTTLLPIALKSFSVFLGICALLFSVAYPDPGSDAFFLPWIQDTRFRILYGKKIWIRDPVWTKIRILNPGSLINIPDHNSKSLVRITVFGLEKNLTSLLRIRRLFDPGSGIKKNSNPGHGIRDKHPGSQRCSYPI
jgi:hypothetical protein